MKYRVICYTCCGGGRSLVGLAVVALLLLPAAVAAYAPRLVTPNPILIPVILLALGLVAGGLWLSGKSHGRNEPLMVSLVGGVTTLIGLVASPFLATVGILLVASAIGWDRLATAEARLLEPLR